VNSVTQLRLWSSPCPYARSQNNGQMTRLASADSTGSLAFSTNISRSHEVSRVWGTHTPMDAPEHSGASWYAGRRRLYV